MQMLRAGGVPVCCDGIRAADESNPRGYFEDERVKRLREDSSWLCEASGRALKVVSPLLASLPGDLAYRAIWIERELAEVMASQRRMLERGGERVLAKDEAALASAFAAQRARGQKALERLRAPWIELEHAEVMASPGMTAERIASFLGEPFDVPAAASVVDPALHRARG